MNSKDHIHDGIPEKLLLVSNIDSTPSTNQFRSDNTPLHTHTSKAASNRLNQVILFLSYFLLSYFIAVSNALRESLMLVCHEEDLS